MLHACSVKMVEHAHPHFRPKTTQFFAHAFGVSGVFRLPSVPGHKTTSFGAFGALMYEGTVYSPSVEHSLNAEYIH